MSCVQLDLAARSAVYFGGIPLNDLAKIALYPYLVRILWKEDKVAALSQCTARLLIYPRKGCTWSC
jgi:hypothetical protein